MQKEDNQTVTQQVQGIYKLKTQMKLGREQLGEFN